MIRRIVAFMMAVLVWVAQPALAQTPTVVHDLRITVLSTMLADEGVGEWGFAALVEADGQTILFDTGAYPDTVLRNAREMKIDLSHVHRLVLSHFHGDHTGGLITLRKAVMAGDPAALAVVDAGKGILEQRYTSAGKPIGGMPAFYPAYQQLGGSVVEHDKPVELVPGVWLTGPVPRVHDEHNWSSGPRLMRDGKLVDDPVSEDSSLVIRTADGLVILTGCGHAGIMNIVDQARAITGEQRITAIVGGLHLFERRDTELARTAAWLKGVRYLLAAHCTGIEATFRLRELLGLTPRTAVIAAVGSRYEAGKGITALSIAGYPGP